MSKLVTLNLDPDPRTLRQFGWIACTALSALSALAFSEAAMFAGGLGPRRLAVAGALLALAVLAALASWLAPRAHRPLYVGLSLLTFPIGVAVSYLLLAGLYFGLFTPLALVFRLIGRDALRRKLDRNATSYWTKAPAPRPRSSYFRQY